MWWRYSVLFAGLLALALYASNPSIDSFRKYCHQNIEAQSGPLSAMFTNLSLWISEKSILYWIYQVIKIFTSGKSRNYWLRHFYFGFLKEFKAIWLASWYKCHSRLQVSWNFLHLDSVMLSSAPTRLQWDWWMSRKRHLRGKELLHLSAKFQNWRSLLSSNFQSWIRDYQQISTEILFKYTWTLFVDGNRNGLGHFSVFPKVLFAWFRMFLGGDRRK